MVALPDPVEADRLAAAAVPGLKDRACAAAAPAKLGATGGRRQAATPGKKNPIILAGFFSKLFWSSCSFSHKEHNLKLRLLLRQRVAHPVSGVYEKKMEKKPYILYKKYLGSYCDVLKFPPLFFGSPDAEGARRQIAAGMHKMSLRNGMLTVGRVECE